MSTSLPALPEPNFVHRDPDAVTAAIVADIEQRLGRTLQPAQDERVMADAMAYRETLLRIAIQEAAKQCLVRYARFPMLDYLGEFKGVTRLPAGPALTTLRFTLVAVQAFDVLVPQGTRVASADGKVIFATTAALTITAGQTTGDVASQAQTAGAAGNGYIAGQVNGLMDTVAHVGDVSNTTLTADGSDQELDDPYRQRIMLAPEGYSTAGPLEGYRYHALQASSAIIDAAAVSPAPGAIAVYLLTAAGAPSDELRALALGYLDGEEVRPWSDGVTVPATAAVNSAWTIALTVYASADANAVLAAVQVALAAYAAVLASKLGQAIIPERIEAVANSVPGVYRAVLSGAALQTLTKGQFVSVTGITVNLVGSVDG